MQKLTINGMEIEVPRGTSILQAAEQLGIEIPRFCYHDKLSVPANCRMCLVEVEGGPPKPVASCAMACGNGMVVKTDSPMVQKARKGVMEMMLINHPLDCPVCDQGGECDLQDQAVGYGTGSSRFHEHKRAVVDKDLGPLISTTMSRCINCTRCIRFAEEIAGTPVLGQMNRGEDSEVGTYVDALVQTELSGNLVDVCPVGALTSRPYAFKARPWELKKTESIDVHDAVGSNIRIDVRGREVMRILPRLHEDVNEVWISDRSRFAVDGLKMNRLDRPYVRSAETGKLVEASWDQAFALIAEKLRGLKGDEIAGLVGDLADLESIVALKDLLGKLGSPNMDCRTDGALFDPSSRAGYLFNSTIAGIEEADSIILVGTNPRHEATMVNARIRKTWGERAIPVYVVGENVDLSYPTVHVGANFQALEKLVKSGEFTGLKPLVIAGSGAFVREDGLALHHALYKMASDLGGTFNMLHRAASRVGALEVGFAPQAGGRDFQNIIAGTKDGSVKALYLLGVDEFDARADMGWQTFVIYQGHHGDQGAARADVILPACAYTEKNATYVNTEGRPQMTRRAASTVGDAREDWTILRALSDVLGLRLPYDSLTALRARITAEFPHLGKIDEITPAVSGTFGEKAAVSKVDFVNPITDYYQTNVICRASETMRECSKAFVLDNKKEAA